jgi:signal recognition particle receptor subunit beta
MHELKIFIIGPHAAGKTSFIEWVCDPPNPAWFPWFLDSFSPEEPRTPFMDFARIVVNDNLTLCLFSWSLQRGFEFFKQFFAEDLFGFIVLVDSSNREMFYEVKAILKEITAYAAAYLVVANKQDLSESWDIDDLRVAFRLPEGIPLLSCVAYREDYILNVLERIETAILSNEDL